MLLPSSPHLLLWLSSPRTALMPRQATRGNGAAKSQPRPAHSLPLQELQRMDAPLRRAMTPNQRPPGVYDRHILAALTPARVVGYGNNPHAIAIAKMG